MNGYTYFIQVVTAASKAIIHVKQVQRKLDREAEQHETAIAKNNNDLTLQDIAIEREKIRLERERLENERLELDNLKKRKNLCLDAPKFEPISYE